MSIWFAALAALVAQRLSVAGVAQEDRAAVIAIPGALLAVGAVLRIVAGL